LNSKNLNSDFRTFPPAVLLKLFIREETQTLVKHREDTEPPKAREEDKTLWRMLKRFTTQTTFISYRLLYLIPLLVMMSLPSA